MSEKVLIIRGDEITALYSDDLRELGGTLHVERASDVEWDDAAQGWIAHVRRPVVSALGPFTTREEALAAEVAFLQARL